MSLRDIEADYKAAYLAEYESYKAAGLDDRAAEVAAVLREQYGHEVEKSKRQTAKRAAAPERADQKAPEDTAEPKAQHSNPKE